VFFVVFHAIAQQIHPVSEHAAQDGDSVACKRLSLFLQDAFLPFDIVDAD
jgi:hypothetical protein